MLTRRRVRLFAAPLHKDEKTHARSSTAPNTSSDDDDADSPLAAKRLATALVRPGAVRFKGRR